MNRTSEGLLSGRLLQLQDEERRRIARELHDTTGQSLSALTMQLTMILSAYPRLDAGARDAIEDSIALAESCVREIRTMSYLLHPPLLEELGLVSALRAYTEAEAKRTAIHFELDLPPAMPRLPRLFEIALFRIAQEGISNIHRHSGSRVAVLRLCHFSDSVELDIADFGRGMPQHQTDAAGIGIAAMRERASQLGGHLAIESNAAGTTLRVKLPFTSSAA
jgi:signal transduction histidine kinase